MREKIKRIKVKIKGFGSKVDNKANGGEGLADCEFLSVSPNYSLAIDSESKLFGWGENFSGILDFEQNGVSQNKFKNVSAGYNHAVGVCLSGNGINSGFKRYDLNYTSANSQFDFSLSYTGNWSSPFWIPKSSLDPYSGFNKRVILTGIFDAGLNIKKYPSQESILQEKYTEPTFFSGNFDLSDSESLSLEVYPKPRLLLPNSTNPWSCRSVVRVFQNIEDTYLVTGWGANDSGKLDFLNYQKNLINPKFALASNDFSLILLENGKVSGFGSNAYGQISNLNTLNNIVDVSAGYDHSLFLDSNGAIYSRGLNNFGQCNFPGIGNVYQIAAGGYNSAVLYKNNINSTGYNIFATGDTGSFNFTQINSIEDAVYLNVSAAAIIVVLKNGSALRFGEDQACVTGFGDLKNCIYGLDGWNFSQFIISDGAKNLNFLEVGADLSFAGKSDQVIENINIDTAIRKQIESIDGKNYIRIDSSLFNVNFESGSYQNSFSDSFLKISGASLPSKRVSGETFIYSYLEDPIIEASNGLDSYLVDDWVSDLALSDQGYRNQIISSGFINPSSFSGADPFLRVKRNLGDVKTQNYSLKVSDKKNQNNLLTDLNEEPNRFVFSWKNLPVQNFPTEDLVSDDRAFIIYDNRTGTTSKNVFAYAFEFEKGLFSNEVKFVQDDYKNYFYNPILNTQPKIISGWHSFTSSFQSICVQKETCEPGSPPPEKEMCIDGASGEYSFPGGGTGRTQLPPTGTGYDIWLSKIKSDFLKPTTPSLPSNSYLYEQGISTGALKTEIIFSGSSGIILFGDFFSGDSLTFKPYNFDALGGYSGLYKTLYLQSPPYAEVSGFILKFKTDFDTPSELLDSLNENFANYNSNPGSDDRLWYWGMGCATGLGATGVFEKITRPLADAFYIEPKNFFSGVSDDTLKHWSGRIIGFKANYYHQSGFRFILQKNSRKIEASTAQVGGYKFVLPNKISLFGSNDRTNWKLLDSRSEIAWSGLEPTKKNVDISYFNSDLTMLKELNHISGYDKNSVDESIIMTQSGVDITSFSFSQPVTDPHYQARDLLNMSKTYLKQEKPFCQAEVVEENVRVFYIGSGISCKTKESGEKESGDKDDSKESGYTADPLIMESVRTGWTIDYKKLSMTEADLFNLNFDYLKVEFENFKSSTELNGLSPLNFFHVNKINFFSLESNFPELQTTIDCWDNGIYEITPSGDIPVNISGFFTADVRAQDSGVRKFSSALISGKLIDKSSGDYIKLNRLSGMITSDSGYAIYSGPLYATGEFCTGISDWFYNSDTKIVDLKRDFCSTFNSGSGAFSGSYLRIKPEIVNRDLAAGRFLNPSYEVNFETGIFYSGFFYAKDYVSGYTGYLKVPYSITGYSTSGFIDFTKNLNGSSFGSEIKVIENPSGYNQASGWFKINENLLVTGDFLKLNQNFIFYNPDSGNAMAPTNFSNFNSLCDILTGDLYSELFNSKFEIYEDKTILVKALPLGDSGNYIDFNFQSASGGISGANGYYYDGSFLSGGKTFYQKISGTGGYSYNINISGYPVTGFYYSNSGSGLISGPVNSYQGERDFTGAWALATGTSSLLQNLNLVEATGGRYSGKYSGDGLGLYPEKLNIAVGYRDTFGIGGRDAALLTIRDENYIYVNNNQLITGSGVSIIIKNY